MIRANSRNLHDRENYNEDEDANGDSDGKSSSECVYEDDSDCGCEDDSDGEDCEGDSDGKSTRECDYEDENREEASGLSSTHTTDSRRVPAPSETEPSSPNSSTDYQPSKLASAETQAESDQSTPWTEDDEHILMRAATNDVNWAALAKALKKTAEDCQRQLLKLVDIYEGIPTLDETDGCPSEYSEDSSDRHGLPSKLPEGVHIDDLEKYGVPPNGRDLFAHYVGFARLSGLRDHMATHGNSKQFECNECGKRFKSLASRRRHTRMKHRDKQHEDQDDQGRHPLENLFRWLGERTSTTNATKFLKTKFMIKYVTLVHRGHYITKEF
ncbi:unnamed protein product [Clonostachys rosea f. rosea IK726]|uniref:Uncharacterized protein n=1 Tax=Clonostachys rosea f. rosea IK726 TaxID=1349383 RepID=A0ACA9UTY6_BIOOC|nr:unnamed protein product [Clonostachys rosea f. rosea IK726]